MGLFLSRSFRTPAHLYPSSVSLFDPKAVSSSRPALGPCRRAQKLSKVGRRANLVACSALARPYLDSFEHDDTLGAVGVAIRGGARFRARINRATTLYPVGPRTRTMMQPCASAAKLRSGGPILFLGMTAMAQTGTRHLESSSATRHKRTGWAKTVGCLLRPPVIMRDAE